MKIIHRVSLVSEPDRIKKLQSLGILFQKPDPKALTVFFDINEDHLGWSELSSLIPNWRAGNIVHSEFSEHELLGASQLQLWPLWHHGYPMPKPGSFGYQKVTYDPKSRCEGNPIGVGINRTGLCGMGMVQVAPFQMKAEPKWGKKHIMQLNWVFGEFFVKPEVWQQVFKPLGIGCEEVLHSASKRKLETVVQLKVENTARSTLVIPDGHPTESCMVCGRTRYHPWTRGFFPSFRESPGPGHIWKTQEIFGSGGSAWNAVIISATLYQEIQKHKLAGVSFMPMAPLGGSGAVGQK